MSSQSEFKPILFPGSNNQRSALRQSHVLSTTFICTWVQMFQLGFVCSLPHFLLRLSLIVLSSWEYPSVGYSLCYCLYAPVLFFLLCHLLLLCSSLLLLQLFLNIQYVISLSPASGGQRVTSQKFAEGLNSCSPQSQNI